MARRRRKAKRLTRAVERKIVNVNPGDRDDRPSFILWFSHGGYATPTYLRVWADHLDDALDEATSWIEDNAPGLFDDDYVNEEYRRAVAGGMSDEAAQDEATMDMTTLDGGHNISSENWGLIKERPTRAEILDLEGREPERRARGVDRLAAKRPGTTRRR